MVQRLIVPLLAIALGFAMAVPALAQSDDDPLVKVANDSDLGPILVDNEGMTLYLYSRDEKGVSNCYDMCEQRWPILRPGSGELTGAPEIDGDLSTIDRRDGTKQVAYNGIPLYYFAQDEKAGDTKGQAVGGVWWILAPGLDQITAAVPQASPVAAAAPAPAAKPSGASAPAAQPTPAAKPAAQAPAQAPRAAPSPAALPRTGSVAFDPSALTVGFGAAGVALTALGAGLLRRRRP